MVLFYNAPEPTRGRGNRTGLTALVLEFDRSSERAVADTHSARLVERAVQLVVFAQLRQDLCRLHRVTPFVVAVSETGNTTTVDQRL